MGGRAILQESHWVAQELGFLEDVAGHSSYLSCMMAPSWPPFKVSLLKMLEDIPF